MSLDNKLFYYVDFSLNEREIGLEYPQSQNMREGYDFEAPNSVHKLSFMELPNFNPDFDYIEIMNKAKLTDIISTAMMSNCGFLVSDNFIRVLSNLKLEPYKLFDTIIRHKYQYIYHKYFWLHVVSNQFDNINFELSQIQMFNDEKQVVIYSFEEFKYYLYEHKMRYSRKNTVYLDGRKVVFDLFGLPFLRDQWICTEKFKEEYNKLSLTGLTFTLASNIVLAK